MPNPIINRRLVALRMAAIAPATLPQLANLVLKLESSDFDAIANGTTIVNWVDKSGKGNTFGNILAGPPVNPVVSGTVLCNGHKTARFDGTMGIGCTSAIFNSAVQGVEMMVVFVADFDPSSGTLADQGEVVNFIPTTGSLQPFSDGNFYEAFGRTDRPNIGNPVTSTAAGFCCYNVTSKADGTLYSAWLNSENFFSVNAGYTFKNSSAPQTLGVYFNGVTNGFKKCNIAAAYGWQVSLSSIERTQARNYINQTWGITF